jgi:hypothetical protein
MAACRRIEREQGLRQVLPQERSGLHQATRDEYRHALREGRPSERMRLQALVRGALVVQPTLGEFVRRLEDHGVEVRLYRAHDGPVVGISYKLEEVQAWMESRVHTARLDANIRADNSGPARRSR